MRIFLLVGTARSTVGRSQQGFQVRQPERAELVSQYKHVPRPTVFPTELHRLERQGWLTSEWGMSENKQRAKYYRLTAAGKKQLSAAESKWELLVKAITRVMKPTN